MREDRKDFYELKPKVKKWPKIYKLSRREEVVINRLRSGHTRVTHWYIFVYKSWFERQPICPLCKVELLIIKHILMDCKALQNVRKDILETALKGRDVTERRLIGEGGVVGNVVVYLREGYSEI